MRQLLAVAVLAVALPGGVAATTGPAGAQDVQVESFPIPRSNAAVHQMLGRPGEVWAAESGTDHLTVYRYE